MPSQEEYDQLKARIAELEQELAQVRDSRDAASAKLREAGIEHDAQWGEFNPG